MVSNPIANLDRACYADIAGLFHNTRKQLELSDRSAEAGVSAVLVNFGFAGRESVDVKGRPVVPRDMLVALMSGYVPPVTGFLAPPKNQPPDWVKEIVTEVRGTQDEKK